MVAMPRHELTLPSDDLLAGAVVIAAAKNFRIAEAIAAGDGEATAAAMAAHVMYSATALCDVLKAEPVEIVTADARKEGAGADPR
jgi:DNA-binding FadR family transcriptional regulator